MQGAGALQSDKKEMLIKMLSLSGLFISKTAWNK